MRQEDDLTLPAISAADIKWLGRKRIDSLYLSRAPKGDSAQRAYDALWSVQREVLHESLAALADAGVTALAIKGAAFHEASPARYGLSAMADVDVLVDSGAREQARRTLEELGLVQGEWSSSARQVVRHPTALIADLERPHYELYPFARPVALDLDAAQVEILRGHELDCVMIGGQPHVLVRVDVHHAIATGIDGGAIVTRREFAGPESVPLWAPADALWATLSRFYAEVALHGKRTLRDFAYVVRLLRENTVDWSVVAEANEQHLLHASLYYYLRFVDWLTRGTFVPADLLESASPLRGARRRDYGWQLGKLFDFIEESPFVGG